ncbi:hypothetical protein BT63DRAFT_436455 [Microthyrium microscopicum]|uniref:Rhamnogalacturonase A n=1 Tax=Microthyrium microscopicum TaxID=703497 RepID=A0A6A6UJY0_9PEZI|nr:hypothetical protein BT63DRAFT_436455 [Microthyrium microscopicum]
MKLLLPLLAISSLASAQLSGKVGPTTSHATKTARKVCNITSYGAKPGKTGDIGPAMTEAFNACKNGGTIVIPSGDWGLRTWVNMQNGKGFAIQWDGVIHRTGDAGGNMLLVQKSDDVEIFSSTGKGAFQGNGYEFHRKGSITGPRILRFVRTTNFAVHDVLLIDAPSFHFSMDTCKNGEVYNMVIKGAYQGGLDGIDVWSDNIHIHDVMVSNKDECVTVKSPAHNILVENIYCNWSGGSAFGSLGEGVDIANVIYRNVYTIQSNQMMMIKSRGGSGSVSNVLFENFIGHSNAYSLDIDQNWSPMKSHPGPGVGLRNITFKNWKGTCANGVQRPPIKIICSDDKPCVGIHIVDFAMWTDSGSSVQYQCKSAYGSGGCLKSGSGGAYATTSKTISSPPAGYNAVRMPGDLKTSTGTKEPIAIPQMPSSFFPGKSPLKALAAGGAGGRLVELFNDVDEGFIES